MGTELVPLTVDRESPASRQHYIDTGAYLLPGQAWPSRTMSGVKLQIENSYTDGHESTKVVELEEAPTVDELDEEDLNNWWWRVAYDHTGDGHGDGSFGRLGSYYKATIIEADNDELVGRYYEWSD